MKKLVSFLGMAIFLLTGAASLRAQGELDGHVRAIVTVLPKHKDQTVAPITAAQLKTEINGKKLPVTGVRALTGPNDPVELVLLVDSDARSSLGTQLQDIVHFINELPPNVRASIAYMENGRAVLTTPLSSDHKQVLNGLRLPARVIGASASPYFCLSDLAQHWPSPDRSARRIAVVVTDGIDPYQVRFDPEDPYVHAAIQDSARADMLIYALYWRNRGPIDNMNGASNDGQSLLEIVTQATGGYNYWQGSGNPVSFQPYFDDIIHRLKSQYEVSLLAPLKNKPEVEDFRLKLSVPGTSVTAPTSVLVDTSAVAQP